MPSKPPSKDSQSWRVQFRLNPSQSEADARILGFMIELNEEGYTDKAICITALEYYYFENAGVPEPENVRNLKEVAAELSAIRRLSIEKIQTLIDILKNRGVSMDDLTDDERGQLARGLDDATVRKMFAGVEGEQFFIDDEDEETNA